ncbi:MULTISPECIES: type VII toxin-antitoxin system MntA family adenylyltransferase antitoxin [unclassified Candidatus Frackibacter]|uniref:type VII toxin-antitoxin system MntA family adenylyltransferase antitoxin n=1 Tax=unclassified Candidatus Frackibacter TaxID=2648818 RepID=UPI00088A1D7D|nr:MULTISPECIES: nucleotidyltransferase domain-containing protein [unclassified Candidatus Frackibacter]SDC82021.1 Predicted nucleotidyltransferase [Candidatus Frackibacter sp. WG11]SEM96244.1 Predicted nucleotidyltransferase [Candidatus Frackibacter sp. WG12]SFM04114.1 Predicted nucleotidyltransferase [Candidatus Frackibacter sp. WG13]
MRKTMNISSDKIELIKSFLIDELSPTLIYLFGSFAKGVGRPDSDIDIAFLSQKNLDEYKVFLIAQKLADQLNREVDLVDINKASTVLKAQIIQGKLIYNADNLKKMNFELETMKKYAKLNEERQVIIDNLKRGVVSD